jgi:hypothetical protein
MRTDKRYSSTERELLCSWCSDREISRNTSVALSNYFHNRMIDRVPAQETSTVVCCFRFVGGRELTGVPTCHDSFLGRSYNWVVCFS